MGSIIGSSVQVVILVAPIRMRPPVPKRTNWMSHQVCAADAVTTITPAACRAGRLLS